MDEAIKLLQICNLSKNYPELKPMRDFCMGKLKDFQKYLLSEKAKAMYTATTAAGVAMGNGEKPTVIQTLNGDA